MTGPDVDVSDIRADSSPMNGRYRAPSDTTSTLLAEYTTILDSPVISDNERFLGDFLGDNEARLRSEVQELRRRLDMQEILIQENARWKKEQEEWRQRAKACANDGLEVLRSHEDSIGRHHEKIEELVGTGHASTESRLAQIEQDQMLQTRLSANQFEHFSNRMAQVEADNKKYEERTVLTESKIQAQLSTNCNAVNMRIDAHIQETSATLDEFQKITEIRAQSAEEIIKGINDKLSASDAQGQAFQSQLASHTDRLRTLFARSQYAKDSNIKTMSSFNETLEKINYQLGHLTELESSSSSDDSNEEEGQDGSDGSDEDGCDEDGSDEDGSDEDGSDDAPAVRDDRMMHSLHNKPDMGFGIVAEETLIRRLNLCHPELVDHTIDINSLRQAKYRLHVKLHGSHPTLVKKQTPSAKARYVLRNDKIEEYVGCFRVIYPESTGKVKFKIDATNFR